MNDMRITYCMPRDARHVLCTDCIRRLSHAKNNKLRDNDYPVSTAQYTPNYSKIQGWVCVGEINDCFNKNIGDKNGW